MILCPVLHTIYSAKAVISISRVVGDIELNVTSILMAVNIVLLYNIMERLSVKREEDSPKTDHTLYEFVLMMRWKC